MEKVFLIGFGSGKKEYLTQAALDAIKASDVIIGSKRLISEGWLAEYGAKLLDQTSSAKILEYIEANPDKIISVIFSGDTGLYSGATPLSGSLREKKIPYKTIPGISSVQLFAASYGIPWQDIRIVSAHGRAVDIKGLCDDGGNLLILTDDINTPGAILGEMKRYGYGDSVAAVGEELGTQEEKIMEGTVEELSKADHASLSILYVSIGGSKG